MSGPDPLGLIRAELDAVGLPWRDMDGGRRGLIVDDVVAIKLTDRVAVSIKQLGADQVNRVFFVAHVAGAKAVVRYTRSRVERWKPRQQKMDGRRAEFMEALGGHGRFDTEHGPVQVIYGGGSDARIVAAPDVILSLLGVTCQRD